MQNLTYNTTTLNNTHWLIKYSLLLTACILLWLIPTTHNFCVWLDYQAFALLNGSLLLSHKWQLFWGYLNHPNESWLNVIVMVGINILGIFTLAKDNRARAFRDVAFFWIFFQFVLLFTNIIFNKWLGILRPSPSLEITPWVILSEVLNIGSLRVSSNCSFPSGHALVLIFWAKFTINYSKPWVHILAVITAFILTLPRLFSGAHWLTDVIFSICYALLWFQIAQICLEKITTLLLNKKKIIGEV